MIPRWFIRRSTSSQSASTSSGVQRPFPPRSNSKAGIPFVLPSYTIHFGLLNRPAWKPKEPVPPCGSPAPIFARLHRERIPTGPVLHSSLRREDPEENPLPGKGVFRSSMPSAVFRFRPPYREIPGSDSCHLPDSVVLPLQKTFGIDQRQQNDLSKKSGTVQRFC